MGEQNNTRQEILERMHNTGVVRIDERVEKAQNLPAKVEPIRSVMINPYSRFFHHHKNILESQKRITFRTLRRVAEKAWLINTIINHQMNRIRPFLKPAPDDNTRGYKVCLKDDEAKPNSQDKKMIRYLEEFIFNTGEKDGGREDNLVLFTSKLVRDVLSILPIHRLCIDSTGLGMQLAENLENRFRRRVEGITFTNPVIEEMANGLYLAMQRLELRLPLIRDLQVHIHSIRKLTTAAKHSRFDVDSSEKRRHHGDRFFSLCLALQAVGARAKDFYSQIKEKKEKTTEKKEEKEEKKKPKRKTTGVTPRDILRRMGRG